MEPVLPNTPKRRWSILLTSEKLNEGARNHSNSHMKINPLSLEPPIDRLYWVPVSNREVDTMTKVLLATVAILAFTAPSLAQQDKTTGQAPPSGASSFYLAQDTATMKCQVVNVQPAAGGTMKVIGPAHPTHASAETALAADKTCK
jgi:hypothetical protein